MTEPNREGASQLQQMVKVLRCRDPDCACAREGPTNWTLHCPAHDDADPSLSVTNNKGRILVHCHAGCEQAAVIAALRDKGLWGRGQGQSAAVDGVPPLPPGGGQGLRLAELAEAKHLDMGALREHWGSTEITYDSGPAIRIPYLDANGELLAVRFRVDLSTSGTRFKWRNGDHPVLYGLQRLPDIKKAGWVLLVEGESDVWTLNSYGLPTLGLPGKTIWRAEWAKWLDGLQAYVWQEPDAEDLPKRLAPSLPNLRVIVAPEGVKDPSEAHIQGRDVTALISSLRAAAEPFSAKLEEEQRGRLTELERKAGPLLAAEDPVEVIRSAIRDLGYGGMLGPPVIAYLATTSRLLALRIGTMPVHLLVIGPASAGKSYTVQTVLRLLPPEALHVIDAGSPRVLIYDDADLRHRAVIFSEADSLPAGEDNPAASAIRNLLQDHRLHYKVTVRDPETGGFTVMEIDKPGPSVLITTTTKRLGDQLMTRLFSLEVSDDVEQIRAALAAQGQLEISVPPEPDPALIVFQAYLQARAPWHVTVPFAPRLAHLIARSQAAPRLLRDFQRLLSLIKAVAVLRHRQREVDAADRLVANIEDYRTARDLVAGMYEDTASEASERVRQAVQAVADLAKEKAKDEYINATDVAAKLRVSKPAATRRINAALAGGWLTNAETRKGYPYKLSVGEPLPECVGLPLPDEVARLDLGKVQPHYTDDQRSPPPHRREEIILEF